MIHCACAIFVREGRFLLAKRAPHQLICPNCWDVIGGHVEPHETIEQALIREAKEEIGLAPIRLVEMRTILKSGSGMKERAAYHFFVVLEWTGGEPVMLGDEHTELRWFTVEEACRVDGLAHAGYRTLFRDIPFPASDLRSK